MCKGVTKVLKATKFADSKKKKVKKKITEKTKKKNKITIKKSTKIKTGCINTKSI